MNFRELYSIREWAPLTDVLDCIPTRIIRKIFPVDVNITCIDAVEDFLALGTSVGIAYWYNRQSGQTQKLKSETAARITCIKIVDSVEYMVAIGNSSGQVYVFQIQKEIPADLDLAAPCTKSKPIERYTIRDLHKSAVSCCEWSKNGMKLYSGDRKGVVVLTEFDYQAHISKSSEIISEGYEIVQLSAHQGYLLVSTLYRSIVCQRNTQPNADNDWIITQIGKKDRKHFVDCGGTFFKQTKSKYPRLICGRPKLRFWLSDVEGEVEKTLLFRDAVNQIPTWVIPILNPKLPNHNKSFTTFTPKNKEDQPAIGEVRHFRNIYSYAGDDTLIVTHDGTVLYILNVEDLSVEAVAKGFRKIIDFCVCNKEIFVLEGERSLLRLAPMPEKPNKKTKIIFNPSLPPPVPIMGSSLCGSFEEPLEYDPEEKPVRESYELPPLEPFNLKPHIELGVESSKDMQNRRMEVFNKISEMDFDDNILHHSGILTKKSRGKRNEGRENSIQKTGGIVEIGHAIEQDENKERKILDCNKKAKEFTTTSKKMEASFCTKQIKQCDSVATNFNFKEAVSQHLPKALSPTTLQQTVAEKAKSLAEELNLPEVSLEPVTDEQLRILKYLSQPPVPLSPKKNSPLANAYPTGNMLKDTSIQTTPQKKLYYIQEQTVTDFADGQPIEDMCHSLRATNIIESTNITENTSQRQDQSLSNNSPVKLLNTQQEDISDIDSFLLDFEKAKDPLTKTPPKVPNRVRTSSSTSKSENESSNRLSSDWEVVDNEG